MQVGRNGYTIKNLYMKRLSNDEVKQIKEEIAKSEEKFTFSAFSNESISKNKLSGGELVAKNSQDFQKFLYSQGIDGVNVKRVSELTFSQPSFLDIKA